MIFHNFIVKKESISLIDCKLIFKFKYQFGISWLIFAPRY